MNGKNAHFNLKNEAIYSKIAPNAAEKAALGLLVGHFSGFFEVIFIMKSGRIAYVTGGGSSLFLLLFF